MRRRRRRSPAEKLLDLSRQLKRGGIVEVMDSSQDECNRLYAKVIAAKRLDTMPPSLKLRAMVECWSWERLTREMY